MEKRLITAISLSILIILAFQVFLPKPAAQRQAPGPVPDTMVQQTKAASVQGEHPTISLSQPNTVQEETFSFDSARYILTFSNIGGAIKTISTKEYRAKDGVHDLEIAAPASQRNYILSIDDVTGERRIGSAVFQLRRDGTAVVYGARSGDLDIVKRFSLDDAARTVALEVTFRNAGEAAREVVYRVVGGSGMIEVSPQDQKMIEVIAKIDGKIIGFKRPKEGRIMHTGIIEWTALKSKYFSLILKPFSPCALQYYEGVDANLTMGLESQKVMLPPGQDVTQRYVLYVGPNDARALKQAHIGITDVIHYGILGGITAMMLSVMKLAHAIFHNWGISIVLLAIIINVVLFPLSNMSFKSIQRMQMLQPQIEKLKIQHKNNPQKLNKDMMELYRLNKVNPFSGCLPLLLQMPIFIALYNGLIRAIELKGAHFLWIKDLSMPEGVPLPFSLPLIGSTINILPIVMAIAMAVQQKLSSAVTGMAQTSEQRQQQQIMLVVMPIMFGFIFYGMPSGLVLYWLINTILTTAEQLLIFKKR